MFRHAGGASTRIARIGMATATLLAGGALVLARGDVSPAEGDVNGMVISVPAFPMPIRAGAEPSPAAQNWGEPVVEWVSYKTPQGHFDISYIARTSLPSTPLRVTPLADADYQSRSSWPSGFRVRPALYDKRHPIYVQDLGAFLEEALSRIPTMGFQVPADFKGAVRVRDLGTKDGETSSWFGTISVDDDMKHSSERNVGQVLMRTAAHELFHALQVNAGWRAMPRWFKEASAAYVEYRVWEPELGASTIKGYLDTGGRFPNEALEDSTEDNAYSASALLVYLQDSFPRRTPGPPVDFVAEMYQLSGTLAADWKGTTDTDYVGYLASSVATRRGYTIQSGLLPSTSSSSGVVGRLSALWTGLLPSTSASSSAVSMFAVWQLFTRAYFVEWDKWARPQAWFGSNASLYDQIADRLNLRLAVEKKFATEWLPLTARLFVVDGENFLRHGGAEAQRGATAVVRLESLDPSDGAERFQPLIFVYSKDDTGKIVGGVTIDPAGNTIAYQIGPNKPDAVTVEILGIKGPVGWAMGRLSHRTRIYSYALLPPAEASYQLTPGRDTPGQQAFTLLWQPAKRLPDQVRTGLRYRVYPSDSATSRGPVIEVGWNHAHLDLTKDPTKRLFYHIVMADQDGHESPEVVVEVSPAMAPPPASGRRAIRTTYEGTIDIAHGDTFEVVTYKRTAGGERVIDKVRAMRSPDCVIRAEASIEITSQPGSPPQIRGRFSASSGAYPTIQGEEVVCGPLPSKFEHTSHYTLTGRQERTSVGPQGRRVVVETAIDGEADGQRITLRMLGFDDKGNEWAYPLATGTYDYSSIIGTGKFVTTLNAMRAPLDSWEYTVNLHRTKTEEIDIAPARAPKYHTPPRPSR